MSGNSVTWYVWKQETFDKALKLCVQCIPQMRSNLQVKCNADVSEEDRWISCRLYCPARTGPGQGSARRLLKHWITLIITINSREDSEYFLHWLRTWHIRL